MIRHIPDFLAYLSEADDDQNQDGNNEQQSDANEQDNSNENQNDSENNNQDDDNDGDNQDQNEEDDQDDMSDDDFSIDANEDPSDEGEENTDGESDNSDSSSDDSSEDDIDQAAPDSLKAKDAQLFETLSPQEQKLKLQLLKKQFLDMYSNCDSIIDSINNISGEIDELTSQLKKVMCILFDLKQMINDYVTSLFDSKSYIENDIMYNYYLSVLNSVKNITTEVKKAYIDTNTEV